MGQTAESVSEGAEDAIRTDNDLPRVTRFVRQPMEGGSVPMIALPSRIMLTMDSLLHVMPSQPLQ